MELHRPSLFRRILRHIVLTALLLGSLVAVCATGIPVANAQWDPAPPFMNSDCLLESRPGCDGGDILMSPSHLW